MLGVVDCVNKKVYIVNWLLLFLSDFCNIYIVSESLLSMFTFKCNGTRRYLRWPEPRRLPVVKKYLTNVILNTSCRLLTLSLKVNSFAYTYVTTMTL